MTLENIAKDAAARAAKNASVAPELLYAPILWALQDSALSKPAVAASASAEARLREALEFYAKEYCEGWCEQDAGCANFDDCGGCLARRVLATFQPSGERREAIAPCMYVGPCGWKGTLASGLVQNEAGIRADEREKCAEIADREAEFWQDAESSSARIVAANIRSARDGGAET